MVTSSDQGSIMVLGQVFDCGALRAAQFGLCVFFVALFDELIDLEEPLILIRTARARTCM
jgi:hypothetical protein